LEPSFGAGDIPILEWTGIGLSGGKKKNLWKKNQEREKEGGKSQHLLMVKEGKRNEEKGGSCPSIRARGASGSRDNWLTKRLKQKEEKRHRAERKKVSLKKKKCLNRIRN